MTVEQLKTLEEMTNDSLSQFPENADEAINEYLINIKEDKQADTTELSKKLQTKTYRDKFSKAITSTSLFIFLVAKHAYLKHAENLSDSTEFEKQVREFFLLSKDDDEHIYVMKTYHMEQLTSSTLGLGIPNEEEFNTPDELKKAKEIGLKISQEYDKLLSDIKSKYEDSKAYLK